MSDTKHTFSVTPKTVYVVTHAHSGECEGGVETVGEFDSHDRALKVAQALREATPDATVERFGGPAVQPLALPREYQHEVLAGAVEAALVVVRNGGKNDPEMAARQVAAAAVAAWQIVKGFSTSLFPDADGGTPR